MKKHNTIKVVLIALLAILLLTWIFPAAYYSGEFVDQGRVQMGLSELFNYPMTALSYFGHIALFIIFVGGFYGVLYKIPAYRSFLDKIVTMFKGKEKLFLAIVIILLSLGVSIAGAQIGFALFIPLIVAVILLMGYDKIVAAMVVIGSLSAGLIGSTYAYSNLSLLHTVLSLDIDYQLGVRFVILAVAVVLVIVNTFMYIRKNLKNVTITAANAKEEKKETVIESVKEEVVEEKVVSKSTSNSKKGKSTSSKKSSSKKSSSAKGKGSKSRKSDNKAALRDDDVIVAKGIDNDDLYLVPEEADNKHTIWPFVVSFILMFVLVVMALITWGENGFGIKLFDDVTESVMNYELFGFPIFAKIYGSINSFGNWTLIDFFVPMFLVLIILVIIYKVKLDEVFDGFISGAKKALYPAAIVLLLYTILVTTTYHPFQLTIYKAILGLSKGFNIVTTAVVGILTSIFNVDPAYVFQGAVPYYISVVTNADNYPIAGIIFQTMHGFASLFAPTSVVLMVSLAYLKVNYKDWLKSTWKLLLELFAVLLIIFIILALI